MTYTGEDRIDEFFAHHGIKGQKWGIRRFQNPDGSLTPEGLKRYGKDYNKNGELTRRARRADDKYRKAISDAYSSKRVKLIDKYMAKAEKDPDNEKRWRKYISKSNDVAIEIRKELDEATDKYTKKHGNIRVGSAIDEVMKERQITNPEHAEEFEEVAESLKASYKDRAEKADAKVIAGILNNKKTSAEEKEKIYKYASEITDDKNVKKFLSSDYVPAKAKRIVNEISKAKTSEDLDKIYKKLGSLEYDDYKRMITEDPLGRKVWDGSAGHPVVSEAISQKSKKSEMLKLIDTAINEAFTKKKQELSK